jgi:uncharacterized membrane protein YdjX (TVP38/TMEM64 family)
MPGMSDPDPRSHTIRRLIPLGVLALAAAVFILSGGRNYLSFSALAEHRELLCSLAQNGGVLAALGFILTYAGVTALSIPGAIIITLVGGFLFGPWLGATYSLTGATIGASVVFLAARAGLSGLADRAGPHIQRLKSGFRKDAFSYLLCLRLMPIFPFWLVNLVAGVMGMRLLSYVVATFVGMIPGALVYAGLGNGAGAVIAAGEPPDLHQMSHPDIFFPLLGLAVLALLPVGFKHWHSRRREAAR